MKIEKAYNIWAKQYDTNKNKTRDLDGKAARVTLEKYDFSTVLELGCGTGKNTIYLLEKAESIIGLDFSEEMLKIAKNRFNDERVLFQNADLTLKWDVPNDFADLITCSLALEHIENLDFVFNQAYKKLKPNGHFFVSELHPIKQYLGSKARYETENGTQELEAFTHHISEYVSVADKSGFELVELNEWFDELNEKEIPRLVSFVFRKQY